MKIKEIFNLRNFSKMYSNNTGNRTLTESIVAPEITKALTDWTNKNPNGVIVGGLALSYHAIPRMTFDIDIILPSDNDIPDSVVGFKRIRPHAYEHNKTHVEIEIVTPEFVNVPLNVFKKVKETAQFVNDMFIASPSGLVCMKLWRLSFQDKADIISLINTNNVDLTGFPNTKEQIEQYEILKQEAQKEKDFKITDKFHK